MNKQRVLIVDDEPDAIEFVKAILDEITEFEVIDAIDGESGLEMAKQYIPDLIILDVMMPGIDGFKVFNELRLNTATREIPVIMLTGVADKIGIQFFKEDMKKFFGSEPVAYIEKPVNPLKLQEIVKTIFNMVS